MATPFVLKDIRTYIASLDATGFSNKAELAPDWEDLDSTTYGSNNAHERVNGLADSMVSIEGLYEAGDLSKPDDVFFAQLGNNIPLTMAHTSGAAGTLAYLSNMMEASYKPGADVGKLFAWSADFSGNQPVARGLILHPQGTARTASGTGSPFQLGAAAANKRMYANLHVFSKAGTTPTLAVKLQSAASSAFGSPTDRATFTTASDLTSQSLSVLGAITDQWWRVSYTITGSAGQSFLFAVSAGIGPN
jgi:hypothetical protein